MLRPDAITVLAGGYSARRFDLNHLPGLVIGVNDAAYYAPKVDFIISMDRLWAENRFAWLVQRRQPTYLRDSTIKNFSIADHKHFIAYACDHTTTAFACEKGRLNGRHSGAVALNLAFQWRPRRLYLVGFDLALGPRGERHWYPDYPWKSGGGTKAGKLADWGRDMADLAAQLTEGGETTLYQCGSTPIAGSRLISSRGGLYEAGSQCVA